MSVIGHYDADRRSSWPTSRACSGSSCLRPVGRRRQRRRGQGPGRHAAARCSRPSSRSARSSSPPARRESPVARNAWFGAALLALTAVASGARPSRPRASRPPMGRSPGCAPAPTAWQRRATQRIGRRGRSRAGRRSDQPPRSRSPGDLQQIARLERQLETRLCARRARRHADAGGRGPPASRGDRPRPAATGRGRGPGVDRRRAPAPARGGDLPSAAASIMPRRWPSCARRTGRPTSRCASSRTSRARRSPPGRARRRDDARLGAHAAELPAGIEAVHVPTTAAHRAALQPPARGPDRDLPRRPPRRRMHGVRRGGTCITPTWSCALVTPPASSRASPSSRRIQRDHGHGRLGMGVALIPSLALVSAREAFAIGRCATPSWSARASRARRRAPSALADALLEACLRPGARPVGRTAAGLAAA